MALLSLAVLAVLAVALSLVLAHEADPTYNVNVYGVRMGLDEGVAISVSPDIIMYVCGVVLLYIDCVLFVWGE